jgi:hypothetical protein
MFTQRHAFFAGAAPADDAGVCDTWRQILTARVWFRWMVPTRTEKTEGRCTVGEDGAGGGVRRWRRRGGGGGTLVDCVDGGDVGRLDG